MNRSFLLLLAGCLVTMQLYSQALFTYGNNEVSKEEFIKAFNKNITRFDNRERSMREYLDLYSKFKLKVKAARDIKIDTFAQLKYDVMNFRNRLESDYPVNAREALGKTNFKRNPVVKDNELFRFADSVTLIPENHKYPIAKETMFTVAGTPVKVSEWLSYVKDYKLNYNVYKGESYTELLNKFIETTVSDYYRKHMEDFNPDFKYQLQEFKEGNLMFEMMERNIWNKATSDLAALKAYYDNNKEHFLWMESADVILVNAKFYAYADYASENMKAGQDWRMIVANSEGMIQGDSGRYEIAQLPLKPGAKLVEGAIMEIVKDNADNGNGASFVKVLKVYPAKLQRSFDEAKSLVINEYQKQLEDNWMNELVKKYPVKINEAVFKSLLK